ncbi:hypothetical protein AB0280_01120 [Pseudarthrobacter sp902506025]|uniref:DNA primase/nucleoside triphosphatase C-terminal domain-containing protein n=1 Tax=Pseudarthrobacter defluvii TaxID=410837 RepID=A0ABT9UMZ9_9MICC|nr:hypothetical protein [Pseudarthrobacter defluvii]MDQ0121020.1 hypothetical protein [Pseudarthrobacter defluvii]
MDASHFTAFLEEATVREFDTDCPLSADCLYGLYVSWCSLKGLRAEADFTFRAAMHRRDIDVHDSRLRMTGPAAADYILATYPAAA